MRALRSVGSFRYELDPSSGTSLYLKPAFGSLPGEANRAIPGPSTDPYVLQYLPKPSSPAQSPNRMAMKNQTSNCMTASMRK
jgi:hypothetical protein